MAGAAALARSMARALAIHRVLSSFASIPSGLKMKEESSFETLQVLLQRAVLEDRLLRAVSIDLLRDGELVVQISAQIDWRTKRFKTTGVDDDEEVALDDGEDFETSLSRRLKSFRLSAIDLVRRHRCDSADWSVVFRTDQHLKSKIEALRHELGVDDVSDGYVKRRRRFQAELSRNGRVGGEYSTEKLAGFGISVQALPLTSRRAR